MMLVTGPAFSGKRTFVKKYFSWNEASLAVNAYLEAQELVSSDEDLPALAEHLSSLPVVTMSEVGGGIVPADPNERLFRERAGRLACLLAERADVVVRLCCGIPEVLKGELS